MRIVTIVLIYAAAVIGSTIVMLEFSGPLIYPGWFWVNLFAVISLLAMAATVLIMDCGQNLSDPFWDEHMSDLKE